MLQPDNATKVLACLRLVGACFTQFALGVAFSFGNLVPYFASYYTYIEYEQSGFKLNANELATIYTEETAKTNWIFFFLLVFLSFGVYLGGHTDIKHGPKRTLFFSSLLMSSGFFLSFFALKYGGSAAFYLCMFTLGIVWSTGFGMGYPVLIVVGMRWFPNKRGIIGGLCLGLFSAGAFIFDALESFFVNPSNLPFSAHYGYVKHPQVIERIPVMCIYIAMITIVLQTISIVCIKNPPGFRNAAEIIADETINAEEQRRQLRRSRNLSLVIKKMHLQMEYEQYSLTVKQAMKFRSFWILCIQTFFYNLISTVAILQWKVFAVSDLNILDDKYLSMVGSVSALGNGIGRIFWGIFFDYTGSSYRLTQGSMSILLTAFIVTWPLCSYAPLIMFPIWNFMIWFQVNCCFAIYPSVICTSFGSKYVASILGCMTFSEIFSTLFVVVMAPNIYLWFNGWRNYLFMMGAFGMATIFLAGVFNPNIDRKQFCMDAKKKQVLSENKRLMVSGNSSIARSYSYATFSRKISVECESLDHETPY